MAPMESDETPTAASVLPPWLEPDNAEHSPPAALQPLYANLPPKISRGLERARRGMRDGHDKYVQNLVDAHTLLAGNEKVSFKDWCIAAGINPKTATSKVQRAEAAKRDANASSSLASKPKKEPVFVLPLKFKDATDKALASQYAQRIIDDGHATAYGEAFLYLGAFYTGWDATAQQKKAS